MATLNGLCMSVWVSAYVFAIVYKICTTILCIPSAYIQSIDFSDPGKWVKDSKIEIAPREERWLEWNNNEFWDGPNYCISNVLIITFAKSSMRSINSQHIEHIKSQVIKPQYEHFIVTLWQSEIVWSSLWNYEVWIHALNFMARIFRVSWATV